MKFPCQKEKSSLFGEIYRPIVELEVETRAGWITLLAYIDSGADISILPASFLKAFGVTVEEEEIREIRGIGGAKVPVIMKDVRMKIGELTFNSKIAIALIEDVPYILGREGVFDKFEICFRQKEKIVEFKPTT
ncbi:MAG: aspartyl protease family protein [Candidatus Brockarchaeota archaeon]|nr:aspartyl protease family protein [Candidatus Brockarchaeota archaeon]